MDADANQGLVDEPSKQRLLDPGSKRMLVIGACTAAGTWAGAKAVDRLGAALGFRAGPSARWRVRPWVRC